MLTAGSSVVAFKLPEHKARTLTFAQASKTWLQGWHADGRLSHGDKTFATQIYLHFNQAHFEQTGELLAWPGWAVLMAKTGLCKTSVFRRLRHLEQLGAFEVEHGRYNPEAKKRITNRYRAKDPTKVALDATLPKVAFQSSTKVAFESQSKVALAATRRSERKEVNLEEKEKQDCKVGLSRKEVNKQEPNEGLPPSKVPSSFPSKTDTESAAAPGGIPPGGSPDSEFVKYDTPKWDQIERFGHRATGKVFMRYGRVEGTWILKRDLKAIEALAASNGDAQ
jgi:hypothetical protein